MATKRKTLKAITSVIPVRVRVTTGTIRSIIADVLNKNTRQKRSKWYREGIAALQSSGCISEWVDSMPDDWLQNAWDLLRNTTGQPVTSDFAYTMICVCEHDEVSNFDFANDSHRQIVLDWLEMHKQDFFNLLAREIERSKKTRQVELDKNEDIVAARKLLQSHGYTVTRNDSGPLL